MLQTKLSEKWPVSARDIVTEEKKAEYFQEIRERADRIAESKK